MPQADSPYDGNDIARSIILGRKKKKQQINTGLVIISKPNDVDDIQRSIIKDNSKRNKKLNKRQR